MSELTTKDAMLERAVAALEKLKTSMDIINPVGVVQAFSGSTTPDGWLLCDGSAVSRTTYAKLFEVIGTTYGAGNGSTTFNVPNLKDKFIEGSSTSGTSKSAGLPEISATGSFRKTASGSSILNNTTGAFSVQDNADSTSPLGANGSGTPGSQRFFFKASDSSSVYGNSTTVQPPALTMRYIIKC